MANIDTLDSDARHAERVFDSVDTSTGARRSDRRPAHGEQFEPTETDIGLDMLFLVTTELGALHDGESFRRAIVYATSPEEAYQRVCSYIDLRNEADAARVSSEERRRLTRTSQQHILRMMRRRLKRRAGRGQSSGYTTAVTGHEPSKND